MNGSVYSVCEVVVLFNITCRINTSHLAENCHKMYSSDESVSVHLGWSSSCLVHLAQHFSSFRPNFAVIPIPLYPTSHFENCAYYVQQQSLLSTKTVL